MNKINIIRILVVGGLFLVGFGAYLFADKPDSPIEQAAETLLRTQGIDIDFSPEAK